MGNPEHALDIQNYRELRNKFSTWIFNLMMVWTIFVILVICLNGFKCFDKYFELDRYVLISVIGTATASVSSLLYVVIKGSFSDIWK